MTPNTPIAPHPKSQEEIIEGKGKSLLKLNCSKV